MAFCFSTITVFAIWKIPFGFSWWKQVYLQIFLCPDKLYFSIPMSMIEGLEINGSLSICPSTVLYGENFFFCKLSTHFSMSYKIVGPRKIWFDILLGLLKLFPTWPKGSVETGTKHFLLLLIYRMPLFSNKCRAPVMSQSGNLGGRGQFRYHDWVFSHTSFSLRTRGNLKHKRIFVWQQFNPLSVSTVDHIKTSASLGTETKESKALEKKGPLLDQQCTVCTHRKDQ